VYVQKRSHQENTRIYIQRALYDSLFSRLFLILSSICCKYKNCSFSFFCYLKKVNHFVLLRQAILK